MRDDARARAARRASSTSRWPTATTLAELDRVDGPALLSLAVRFGTTRLIDNEPLGDPPRRDLTADRGRRSPDPRRLSRLLRRARRVVPVPAGLLPRPRASASTEIGVLTAHPGGRPARRWPRSGAVSPTGSRGRARRCRWPPGWRRPGRRSCSWRRTSRRSSPARSILYAGLSGIGPTLDARTLETLGPARRGRFGEVRAFGSLAFVARDAGRRLPARRGGRAGRCSGSTSRSCSRPRS